MAQLLLAGLFPACQTTTAAPTPTMPIPAPAPTEASNPESTSIKPLEGQTPTPAPAGDAPIINYNQIKEGSLSAPNEADEWVFNAKAGERVNIVLNSPFDSYLELLNPNGEFIASNDDTPKSLNATLFDVQITQHGPHTIIVRGYNGATGSYVLALTGGHPTVGGGTLTSGESRNALLSEQGYKWRYEGQQGTYLTLTVTAEKGVDSLLSLFGPDGTLLTLDDDSGGSLNPEIYEFELPADGAYTIQARTLEGSGLITLTLTDSPQPSGGGPLAAGQTQIATLKPGREHRWQFTGLAGQIINLSMASVDFAPFLELRDSQGGMVAESGPESGTITTFALPADDVYVVVARSADDQSGGDYELTLKPVKIGPGGGPLEPDQSIQAALPPGQVDTWTFEAESSTYVTLQTQSTQLDTYLELYGPDGALLSGDDDSGGDINAAILDFPLAESGQYQVVVKPSPVSPNEGGVYSIRFMLTRDLASSGRLENGDTVESELEAGEQHTWTFEAEEGAIINAQMESDTLDTYLSLYDSSGELLYVNDDSSGKQAAIDNFIVPRDGKYRIVARAYGPDETGSYTLSLQITDTPKNDN